ncbi:MAG: AAA family ATPase [Rhodoferax sp.]
MNATSRPFTPRKDELRGELILIRGLPGSGKTTMAKVLALVGFKHFEADMFFELDGVYHYDASRIREAHVWCQKMARQALAIDKRVVVSNTFTRLQEMEPYRSMTENVRVVEATGRWDNLHGVPAGMMQRMAERWEALPSSRSTSNINPEQLATSSSGPRVH